VEHKFKKQPFVSITAQKNQPQNEAGWRRERVLNLSLNALILLSFKISILAGLAKVSFQLLNMPTFALIQLSQIYKNKR
jgi:hypothetical protein